MKTTLSRHIRFLLAFVFAACGAHGNALDTLVFGDAASEQAHHTTSDHAEPVKGGLDEPAVRLLPLDPVSYKGGTASFTMKVDPKEQNYLTVKLWGSDMGKELGRLVLFANGLQVGYRMESDYDDINQTDEEAQAPGRFVYATLPLPLKLTGGKTSLDLQIVSLGPIWYYGQNFSQYQKNLEQPTRGIYRAYTHTAPRFVPADSEKQGAMPVAVPPGSTPGPEVSAKSKEVVKKRLTQLLDSAAAPRDHKAAGTELILLGEAYHAEWTPAFQNPRVIDLIVRDGDVLARAFAADPKTVEGNWSGAGPLGQAIMRTWPAIATALDEKIALGAAEVTRREAWTRALKQSVDYWRTHRRSYTNQSMIVDLSLFTGNRALQLIAPELALPEERALRYLHEAAGIEPWLGSDPGGETTGEKDVPMRNVHAPYGKDYRLITRKGLSRELGYVASYGETIQPFICDMFSLVGDQKLREQVRKMQLARLNFRYPAFDREGRHCMKLVSEICNRTAHYPQAGSAYVSSDVREAWWMELAALLADEPAVVGAAQQSIKEGQYFSYIGNRLNDPDTLGMMKNVGNWEKVSKLPPSRSRLPMTPGQPDFVFADEENAIIALKHGDTSMFINLYYRAERAVNRVARIFEQTPTATRISTVRTDVQVIESGQTYERPDWIDRIRSKGLTPPGERIHQAYAGEKMPISKRPDDAPSPTYGEWGPFLGKAAFYSLQYGDYLIGLNTTETNTYDLKVPSKDRAFPDLVSKKEIQPADGVLKVGPLSTVVLYLAGEK
ncbi:MAG: hypothetical protein H7A48_03990 [Akkermansiaceae bacterium]|nr:hypothetical protein [Akkermansiaceae bacterium]